MENFKIGVSVVALIGLLFIAGRLFLAASTIDPQAINQLKNWVAMEYTRYQLSRENLALEEKALMLQYARNIEFISIHASGPADNRVFRVEVKPNPAQPPNSPSIRHYRLSFTLLTGWNNLPRDVSALTYYLAFFNL